MKRVWHVVRGLVTAPGGRIPSSTFVSVVKSTTPVPENALVIASDGAFELRLPDGTFTLRGHSEDGELSGECEVTLPPVTDTPVKILLTR